MNKENFSKVKNILFLDIETVSSTKNYEDLSPATQELWDKKAAYFKIPDKSTSELWSERAAIFAEFGKVVVIGCGYFKVVDDQVRLVTKSFYYKDEKRLLQEFDHFLKDTFGDFTISFCAHNGKEFDYPYLSRRYLINGLALPRALNLSGLKPWEVPHLDTMEMWKFGDFKSYTSLDLLANVFDIPSSKGEMDGSIVGHVYYQEQDLPKIARYCLEDVIVTAQLYLKLKSLPAFDTNQILG